MKRGCVKRILTVFSSVKCLHVCACAYMCKHILLTVTVSITKAVTIAETGTGTEKIEGVQREKEKTASMCAARCSKPLLQGH